MLVAGLKPFEEIISSVEGSGSILVAGCGGCTSICSTGGLRESEALADRLRSSLKIKIKAVTVERQCDDEFVKEIGAMIDRFDAVLSLGCGAGVQLVAEFYPGKRIYPALNSIFTGTSHNRNTFIERCRACGDCRLGTTAGICPVTMCAKGLQNGPCGGSENGLCETGGGRECAWCRIIERMSSQQRLEELDSFREPVQWTGQVPRSFESGRGVR